MGANPPTDQEEAHLFRPRHRWDRAEANRWLAFLAHHLDTIGSRDLAWWQLRRAAPRPVALAAGLTAGLTLGFAAGIFAGLAIGLANGVAMGLVVVFVFGIAVGLARGLTVGLVFALAYGLYGLAAGMSTGLLAHQPRLGLTFAIPGGVVIVGAVVLAVRGAGSSPAQEPAYADLRLRGRTRLLVRKLTGRGEGGLRRTLGVRLVLGLLFTLADGLAHGLLLAIAIALGAGIHQPSGRYLVTIAVLRVQQRIPLRLLSFLDDAHRLGILREAGPVYQFRHAKLQDRLAQTHAAREVRGVRA
jgi:hypothetical protein